MSDTILDQIVSAKRKVLARAKSATPLGEIQARIRDLPRPRNFFKAVTKPNPRGLNLIAEIKKASPSAGLIREDFDPVRLAQTYTEASADAVSCLTEEDYFQGRLAYLNQVKRACPLPILRKDFIFDPYQLYESRVAGADAVLLIAEILPLARISDLMILAGELNLSVLLEVHSAESLLAVRSMIGFPRGGYSVLGINNRDLRTMKVDIGHGLRLAGLAGEGTPLVAESGIRNYSDIRRLQKAGFRAVLIGETFMRAENIAEKVNELMESP